MSKLLEILQDNSGKSSSLRLIVIIGFVWLLTFTTVLALKNDWGVVEISGFFSSIYAVLTGSKLIQKQQEKVVKEVKDDNLSEEKPLDPNLAVKIIE